MDNNLDILEFFKDSLKQYIGFEIVEKNNCKFYYIKMYGKSLMVTEEEYNNFKRWLEC